MGLFVTVAQADKHLRLDMEGEDESPQYGSDDRLPDLVLKIAQAEGIVINYLKLDVDGIDVAMNGDADTSPDTPATWSAFDLSNVQASVMLLLSALWDDGEKRTVADYMKADGVVPLLLARLRDPAIA